MLTAWYGEPCLLSAWFNFKAVTGLSGADFAWPFRAGRQDVMADKWTEHCKWTLPLRWLGSPRQTIWSHWDTQMIICVCMCVRWGAFFGFPLHGFLNVFVHSLLRRVSCPQHAVTTNYTDLASYQTHSRAFFSKTSIYVCLSIFNNGVTGKWGVKVTRTPHPTAATSVFPILLYLFLSLLLSLRINSCPPLLPWQSELGRVIPPSTVKSFTSPTQPWTMLHKANAVWACVYAQSMPFDLQAHTQINGRRRLWSVSVAESRDVGVLFNLFVSHSSSAGALFLWACANDNQCEWHIMLTASILTSSALVINAGQVVHVQPQMYYFPLAFASQFKFRFCLRQCLLLFKSVICFISYSAFNNIHRFVILTSRCVKSYNNDFWVQYPALCEINA